MLKSLFTATLLVAATAVFAAPQDAPSRIGHPTAAPAAGRSSPIKPGDRDCLRHTGSLIPAKKGECLPVTGRSYSKDDIDATGARTLAPALERLDPAITVRGGGY